MNDTLEQPIFNFDFESPVNNESSSNSPINKSFFTEKVYDISSTNQTYLDAFRKAKYPNHTTDKKHKDSWAQYKSSCGRFMEMLQKDAITIDQLDLELVLSTASSDKTRLNRIAHIKSLLTHALAKNVAFSRQRASSFVLIFTDTVPAWLLSDKAVIKRLTGY